MMSIWKGKYQFTENDRFEKTFKVIDSEVKMNFHPLSRNYHPHYPCRVEAHHRQMASKEWAIWRFPTIPCCKVSMLTPRYCILIRLKKYYIYSTTDGQPGWGGWYFSVFSSDNLKDWKDEGVMLDLKSDQVTWADGNAWAPCIEEKNGGRKV